MTNFLLKFPVVKQKSCNLRPCRHSKAGSSPSTTLPPPYLGKPPQPHPGGLARGPPQPRPGGWLSQFAGPSAIALVLLPLEASNQKCTPQHLSYLVSRSEAFPTSPLLTWASEPHLSSPLPMLSLTSVRRQVGLRQPAVQSKRPPQFLASLGSVVVS